MVFIVSMQNMNRLPVRLSCPKANIKIVRLMELMHHHTLKENYVYRFVGLSKMSLNECFVILHNYAYLFL